MSSRRLVFVACLNQVAILKLFILNHILLLYDIFKNTAKLCSFIGIYFVFSHCLYYWKPMQAMRANTNSCSASCLDSHPPPTTIVLKNRKLVSIASRGTQEYNEDYTFEYSRSPTYCLARKELGNYNGCPLCLKGEFYGVSP